MTSCEVCGNRTVDPYRVVFEGTVHFYDTLECTIYALAVPCDCCGAEVIGLGVETEAGVFCSPYCAMELARAS
jgi:hypothetical protein